MSDDVLWTEPHRPGDVALHAKGEPGVLLLDLGEPVDAPNWAKLPPELGGAEVRVLSATMDACPLCEGAEAHTVRHLVLDGPGAVRVAECQRRGFIFYTLGGGR